VCSPQAFPWESIWGIVNGGVKAAVGCAGGGGAAPELGLLDGLQGGALTLPVDAYTQLHCVGVPLIFTLMVQASAAPDIQFTHHMPFSAIIVDPPPVNSVILVKQAPAWRERISAPP
jgi:hypothetical protein